ncbi:5-formyltetrahydrofolate cyclo-ligase [Defluviimonas sp. SAOS-178_SWC]|uniref:5-formyltetrahydrofolate cyclo-ligase n=1 Tax=Defluviimonas sp. SAOS-178_SWC TaxID=3121287 RepID=UPI0032214361
MTLAEIKAAARAEAFARRKVAFQARTDGDADRLKAVLAEQGTRPLAGYMPMRTEIDCLPAMAAHDGPVGVPVILGPGQALKFRRWAPDVPMVAGAFGALIPESGEWIVPEVLVVPLLAFDRRGYRLGYGGGFYDRTLEALRAAGPVMAIGFAFAAQEVDAVPIEATDQKLDLIVTEAEVIVPGKDKTETG